MLLAKYLIDMLASFAAQDLKNPLNSEQITLLVDRFYTRVRQDDVLGPVFAAAIGDDWEPHLKTMRDFWSSLMLTSGRYKGNPMLTHLSLPRIGAHHFERWLGLWKETTTELFSPKVAAHFVSKAESMARHMLETIDNHHASISATT